MNYKVHYAPLDLQGKDIEVYEFKKSLEATAFILSEPNPKQPTVYLIAIDEMVFVSEYISFISIVFQSFVKESTIHIKKDSIWQIDETVETEFNIFLQEYASYEEAYKAALEMKEESPLCYS
jgi:hypothetical protein